MFVYRGLFLAATILSTSIVLADILIEPDLKHQYQNRPPSPQYHPVSQSRAVLPVQQYYAKQLTGQPSMPAYPMAIHTIYPHYRIYQDQDRSHLVGNPLFHPFHDPFHQHFPYSPNHHWYMRIGGRKYVQPSVFVGNPQTSVAHQRYKRSSSSSIEETSKSAAVTHDDAMAAKSSLVNKGLTAIDSYLPEDEPIDTNDKHVKSRQSTNEHDDIMRPLLLGLYPENMHRGHQQRDVKIKYPVAAKVPASTPKQLDAQSTANPVIATVTEPTRQITPAISQEKGQDHGEVHINYDPHPRNMLSKDTTKSSAPILASSNKASDKESASRVASHNEYYNDHTSGTYKNSGVTQPEFYQPTQYETSWNLPNSYYPFYKLAPRNFPDPRPIISPSYSPKTESEQNTQDQTSHKKFLQQESHDEDPLGIQKLDALNPDEFDEPYEMQILHDYPEYAVSPQTYTFVDPWKYLEEDYDYRYSNDLDHVAYKNSGALSNLPLTTNTVETLPCTVQMQQVSSTYNYPKTRYVALPQTYRYYYINPASLYKTDFSSAVYY